eukprot:SAG31_NODE_39788_length_285_cov_1.107527_1_plen_37_part_01
MYYLGTSTSSYCTKFSTGAHGQRFRYGRVHMDIEPEL